MTTLKKKYITKQRTVWEDLLVPTSLTVNLMNYQPRGRNVSEIFSLLRQGVDVVSACTEDFLKLVVICLIERFIDPVMEKAVVIVVPSIRLSRYVSQLFTRYGKGILTTANYDGCISISTPREMVSKNMELRPFSTVVLIGTTELFRNWSSHEGLQTVLSHLRSGKGQLIVSIKELNALEEWKITNMCTNRRFEPYPKLVWFQKAKRLPGKWTNGITSKTKLALLRHYYKSWMNVKMIGMKLHNSEDWYIMNPLNWDISPCHPSMPLLEMKQWYGAMEEAEEEAIQDYLRFLL